MLILIRGEVTQQTADQVATQLASDPEAPVTVNIDSQGGDLFAGLQIYEMLEGRDPEIMVTGMAGSIASVIALSGKTPPRISPTGRFAIHNAQVNNVGGDHNSLTKVVNALSKYSEVVAEVYARKTNLDIDEAKIAMDTEQVFTAKEAVQLGFASEIADSLLITAKITKIDMGLLDKIRNNITNGVEDQTPEVVTEEVAEQATMELDETSLAQVQEMIDAAIAAALAGQTEEIANSVATILNEIQSKGSAPQKTDVPATSSHLQVQNDAVSAFYKAKAKMQTKNNIK